ncbi:MAG: hypothetical protein Q9191_002229 [Dirinaria sp. TL-2023a]
MDPGTAIAVVEISAKVLSIIWKYYCNVKDARSNIQSLTSELQDYHNVSLKLQELLQKQPANAQMTSSATLGRTIEQSLLDIKYLENKLNPGAGDKLMKRVSKLQRFKSTLLVALNTDQTSLLVDMKDLQITSEEERLLEKLPMAQDASFNSYNRQYEAKCLAETRVEVLERLQQWRTHHQQRVFWLSASQSPQFRHRICDAISAHGDTVRQGLRNQWREFIIEPLSKIKLERRATMNFVIDALDECSSDDDIRLLLHLFVEVGDIDNVDLGIFVTSRPEITIRLGFKKMPEIIHYDLDLRDIPREVVQHDISVYLRHELDLIKFEQGLDDWPDQIDVPKLVLKADCLFIYAATACRFIGHKSWDPVERLSSILENESGYDGSTTQLDVLMITAISQKTEAMLYVQTMNETVQSLIPLIEDARRFILSYRGIIEESPLQVYASALVFSPRDSMVRKNHSNSLPAWLHQLPTVPQDWDNCIQTLENPSDVVSFAFSPDGKYMACVVSDGTISLWDPATGGLQSTLVLQDLFPWSVAFSPDGVLAIAFHGGKVCLLDPITGKILRERHLNTTLAPVDVVDERPLAFLPNGKLIVGHGLFSEAGGEVRIWDWKVDELSERLHPEYPQCIFRGCSLTGKLLLECRGGLDTSSRYYIYEPTTSKSLPLQIAQDYGSCCDAAIASDKYAALAFSTGEIILLDLTTGLQNSYQNSEKRYAVEALAFSLDAEKLAIVYSKGAIELLELQTGRRCVIGYCQSITKEVFVSIAFSPDGRSLATACKWSTVIQIWRNAVIPQNAVEENDLFADSADFANIRMFDSPGGASIAFFRLDDEEGLIEVYDTSSHVAIRLRGHNSHVDETYFSPDDRQLAAAYADGSIGIWDLQHETAGETITCKFLIRNPDLDVHMPAFSPQGEQLAFACNGEVQIWSFLKGVLLHRLPAPDCRWGRIVYSATGQLVGLQSSGIKVFDAINGHLLHSIKDTTISSIGIRWNNFAFAPDDIHIAYCKDPRTIVIYNLKTRQAIKTLSIYNDSYTITFAPLVFSPDSKLLTVWNNTYLGLLNTDTAKIAEITNARPPVIDFAENGRYLETSLGRFPIVQSDKSSRCGLSNACSCWSIRHDWIFEGEQKMLWLPPACRTWKFAHRNGFFVCITGSGRILTMDFSKKPVLPER